MYASIYAYMLAYADICAHLRIYASIYAYLPAHGHVCSHLRIYASLYAYMLAGLNNQAIERPSDALVGYREANRIKLQ